MRISEQLDADEFEAGISDTTEFFCSQLSYFHDDDALYFCGCLFSAEIALPYSQCLITQAVCTGRTC